MKKLSLLLLAALLLPAYAHALDLPFFGDDKDEDKGGTADEPGEKTKRTFLIHFKSGGTLETDNYTVKGDNVIVMMPTGAIYLEKKMVSSIEEVAGPEDTTVQKIQIQPSEAAPRQKPAPPKPAAQPADAPAAREDDPTDDEGHNERWWQDRVALWKKKKAAAEARYSEAEGNWNKYNGQIVNLGSGAPEYEVLRLQDLRGSARVSMDKAQADIDEANRMLDDVIPDEARKAGAPPGWAR